MPPRTLATTLLLIRTGTDQYKLIKNFEKYFDLKANKLKDPLTLQDRTLPYNSKAGLCSGLVAYWLYCIRIGKGESFEQEFKYVLDWDAAQFANSPATDDKRLEQFINDIMFLHFDRVLRPGIKQEHLHSSLAVVLPADGVEVKSENFNSTFVFNSDNLTVFLESVLFENKMLRLSNGEHSIGIIKQNGHYVFYNPVTAPVEFNSINDLAQATFASLVLPTISNTHVALNFNSFDLITGETVAYPNLQQFYAQLTADPTYKATVLGHPNLFHLAARYGDYTSMDFLFASGFLYTLWKGAELNEVSEAVKYNQPQILNYLLIKGLSPNVINPNTSTPLGHAIYRESPEMVVELLAAGAEINQNTLAGISPLEDALSKQLKYFNDGTGTKNKDLSQIIAILLGCGAKVTPQIKEKLKKVFHGPELSFIYQQAATITTEILHIPLKPTLKNCSTDQLIDYLQMKGMQHSFKDARELLKLFDKILDHLKSQSHVPLTAPIMRDLNIVLQTLDFFIAEANWWHPVSTYIARRAQQAKNKLNNFLKENHSPTLPTVPKIGVYFSSIASDHEPLDFSKQLRSKLS